MPIDLDSGKVLEGDKVESEEAMPLSSSKLDQMPLSSSITIHSTSRLLDPAHQSQSFGAAVAGKGPVCHHRAWAVPTTRATTHQWWGATTLG